MAGRPRKMARRVTELEEMAFRVAAETQLTIPRQYRDNPDPEDPTAVLWRASVEATIQAYVRLEQLATRLRAKAGVSKEDLGFEPDDWVATKAQRQQSAAEDSALASAPKFEPSPHAL